MEEEKEKWIQHSHKTVNKMAIVNSSLLIITLNVNRLSSIIHRHSRVGNRLKRKKKEKNQFYAAYKRFASASRPHSLPCKWKPDSSRSYAYIRQNRHQSKTVTRDTEDRFIKNIQQS